MKFKRGEINILSCSTTMEMGVDIGGISTVVMTNVPPAPANYRQRVGRAGRRNEERAIGLTFCRDNPLGWAVFRRPTWPFDHAIRPPSVSLDSPTIVQRHVNALLLSAFLKQETATTGDNALNLRVGWFFGTDPMSRGQAPSTRFLALCTAISGLPQRLQEDIEALVALTCLDGRIDLARATADQLERVAAAWYLEWDALLELHSQFAAEEQAARRSVDMQMKRLQDEYLLSELANRAFLPSYGFPTDIVPFVRSLYLP